MIKSQSSSEELPATNLLIRKSSDSWTDVTNNRWKHKAPLAVKLLLLLHGFFILLLCVSVWRTFSPIWASFSAFLKEEEGGYMIDNNNSERVVHSTEQVFQWDDIVPSESLVYTPCFSSFLCARLLVPLNWNATLTSPSTYIPPSKEEEEEEEEETRVAVAIIKLPAKVPVTDPRYGGPIILNPGGPGESGIYQVLSDGKSLQTLVDRDDDGGGDTVTQNDKVQKYFDILSFDPRGVNNTTPRLRCFPNAFSQQVWQLQSPDYGLLWHSESIIGMEWGRAAALGASCSNGKDQAQEKNIVPFLNTAQTVEDMLQIVEKEGEWREQEARRRLLTTENEKDEKEKDEIMKRLTYLPGSEKIQYWGMSYGTLLGATFAAMHPDRVNRMILDGVVDPADHYSGRWLTQLQDSDKIVSKFCEYCFQAGPEKCPIYTGSSAADIEARFTSILYDLKENPIAVLSSFPSDDEKKGHVSTGGGAGPGMITYNDLHLRLLSGLYFPFNMAESLYDLLLAVESRNSSSRALASMATRKQAALTPSGCHQGEQLSSANIPYVSGVGAFQAISCMDIGGPLNLTRQGFRDYLAELLGQSQWIGPSWARNKLACEGFIAKPAWKPTLTFETQEWANTSHPLLIIGNSHDTVTPLRNAQRVSKELFPGSVVLHQDSEGHCSHSSPSLCTAKVIREYFQTGRLPAENTICEPEVRPFLGCVSSGNVVDAGGDQCSFVDASDAKLWTALVELADPFKLKIDSIGMNAWHDSGYPIRGYHL